MAYSIMGIKIIFMQYYKSGYKAALQPVRKYPYIHHGKICRLTARALCALFAALFLFASCGENNKESTDKVVEQVESTANIKASERGKKMEQLLNNFNRQSGKKRFAAAKPIFDLLYREEMTDSLLNVTPDMPIDSLDMQVWYWAGEYFYETQDNNDGLHYAMKALPLTLKSDDLQLQSDCERLVGLFYFRRSDYVQAIEYTRKSLEIDRRRGDKSRISSSLNTLAGICLVAKQLKDGERYIIEAIRYSTAAQDSNRMAIQYGMASEIYHAMRKEHKALNYARRAYELDQARGNTAKVGIRLSQMTDALMSLGQFAEAERSVKRAIPILEKADNKLSLSVCHNQMGELLNRRGAHAEAAQYFEKAAEVFAARKDLYNESRARIGLYEALKDTNPTEASRQAMRYAALKDSIYHHEMEQNVSRYNVKYKTEEMAHQKEREHTEKRIILIVSIALIAILLLVVAALIYMSRIRRRSHQLLERMSRLREHFFTNITHEFRTPLTIILGLSHELQGFTGTPDEMDDKAKTIERQGNGLLMLINQLLDISKIKSSVGDPDWRNGNISAYLAMIAESYRDLANSRNINLQFFSKDNVNMDFVPDYARKVLNNLLSNAFKFTPEYGKVRVLVWREENQLHIDVSDTGKGMDKETCAHIFEPFYQGETDMRNIGTGVGLTLVKQIIDSINGTITVESEQRKGTTFHIKVPIRNQCRQHITDETEMNYPMMPDNDTETPMDSDSGNDNANRLLIIEDNSDIAAYIGSQFTDRYDIAYASNGNEGIEKALELVPDLIITDLMMPGIDGLELCRQVRSNEIINHIPIIVITAKSSETERIKGIEAGADAYLYKPFNTDELLTRVEKLLEGRRIMREKFGGEMIEQKENNSTHFNESELRFISKVTDAVYLQLSRRKEINVSLIASIVCMSNSQFYRKIVALTGYTPTAYIQRIKIKKAKLLLDGDPKISFAEVADKCGFDAYPNFVRAFKNVCGVTPTDYRKRENL